MPIVRPAITVQMIHMGVSLMPYTAHDPEVFYAAIVARIAASTGKNVGLGIAPADTTLPYAVVYQLGDESSEGALNDPTQIVVWSWQVTAVGSGAQQAQWMQTKVREALHGHIPTVAGLGTTPIELVDGGGVDRDDLLQPSLFYARDRYIAYTSI